MEEQTFFREGNVAVTRSRVVVGNQTYPVANITSIRTDSVPPNRTAPTILGFVGAIVLFTGFSENFMSVVFGVGLIAGAVVLWRRAKPTYDIFFGTSGGEKRALESEDADYVTRVGRAIDEALMASR